MSIGSNWLTVLFKSSISSLISAYLFYQLLKDTTLARFISPCNSIGLCFVYFEALLLAYKYLCLLRFLKKSSPLSLREALCVLGNVPCSGSSFFSDVNDAISGLLPLV